MVLSPHWPKRIYNQNLVSDIDKIRQILSYLGNPEKSLRNVISVTGTNGKGSCIAFLSSILQNAGYITNSYISPHIHEFNERIMLGNIYITDNELYATLEEIRDTCEQNEISNITIFEASTIAAILAFSKNDGDFNIFEVGMGGAFDATNVFETNLCTIISNISYDHEEYLGNSLESIATHKSLLIRDNSYVISSLQQEEVSNILQDIASKKNSYYIGQNIHYQIDMDDDYNLIYSLPNGYNIIYDRPALPGIHQYYNAGLAITTAKLIDEIAESSNGAKIDINDKHISRGLANVKWICRMEEIYQGKLKNLLKQNDRLFIDGAHNNSGAKIVANFCHEFIEEQKMMNNHFECYIILGRSANKDHASFISTLLEVTDYLTVLKIKNEAESEKGEILYDVGQKIITSYNNDNKQISFVPDLYEAIHDIANLEEADRSTHKLVIICGSLYFRKDMIEFNE